MTCTIEQICQAHGLTRQAFYQMRQRRDDRREREQAALELVRQERQLQPRLGTRKLYQMYQASFQELGIGRDKLFALLRREGLLLKPRRQRRSTTNSRHRLRRFENLVREREPTGCNEVWVADLTYLETKGGFRYAAFIMDAYSRKIIGYDLSASLALEGSLRAVQQALDEAGNDAAGVIHHSDQGVQYCSHPYVQLLEEQGAQVSMAAVGNPYENAQAERVIGTLKREYFLDVLFESEEALRQALDETIRLYNERRPHLALDYATPAEIHARTPMKLAA